MPWCCLQSTNTFQQGFHRRFCRRWGSPGCLGLLPSPFFAPSHPAEDQEGSAITRMRRASLGCVGFHQQTQRTNQAPCVHVTLPLISGMLGGCPICWSLTQQQLQLPFENLCFFRFVFAKTKNQLPCWYKSLQLHWSQRNEANRHQPRTWPTEIFFSSVWSLWIFSSETERNQICT